MLSPIPEMKRSGNAARIAIAIRYVWSIPQKAAESPYRKAESRKPPQ